MWAMFQIYLELILYIPDLLRIRLLYKWWIRERWGPTSSFMSPCLFGVTNLDIIVDCSCLRASSLPSSFPLFSYFKFAFCYSCVFPTGIGLRVTFTFISFLHFIKTLNVRKSLYLYTFFSPSLVFSKGKKGS